MKNLDMKKATIGAGAVAGIAVLLPWWSAGSGPYSESASGLEYSPTYAIPVLLAVIGGVVMQFRDNTQASKLLASAPFGAAALIALMAIVFISLEWSDDPDVGSAWGGSLCVLASAVAAGTSWKGRTDVNSLQESGDGRDASLMESRMTDPKRKNASDVHFDADFWAFRTMLTPLLIRALFWLGTACCVLGGVQGLSDYWAPKWACLVLICLGPVIVRTLCESLIVRFQINETLTEVLNELRRKN